MRPIFLSRNMVVMVWNAACELVMGCGGVEVMDVSFGAAMR